MKKLFQGIATLVVGLLVSATVYAAQVQTYTGPAGANPYDPSNIAGVFNQLIQNYDAAIGNGSQLGTHVGLFSEGGFQLGATSKTGSMTLGTTQPGATGTNTLGSLTVKFYINFVDSLGVQSYIPVWQ